MGKASSFEPTGNKFIIIIDEWDAFGFAEEVFGRDAIVIELVNNFKREETLEDTVCNALN